MTQVNEVSSLAQFYREHEDKTTVSYRAFTDRVKKVDKYPTLEAALELDGATTVAKSTLSFDMEEDDEDVFSDIIEEGDELKTEGGEQVKKPRGA